MKKIELLSPAGSMDALKAAIHNGADAIYLGGKKFGARAFAQNFSVNELLEAINYAHIYNVKIYITVNTIIYEDEFEDALDFIEFLYKNNVDAVIMQDIGLMYEAHKRFPGLIIHASTQCHNHNIENIEFFKSIGVKRVILDREMSLEEIKKLNTDMEIEIFIHGALCISYSGCCLMSYLGGGRSGNRGECTGCCRLPYKLIENNKEHKANGEYLISTKELNTSKRIKEIMDSNIVSLKIEGRMKTALYVATVARTYRKAIDDCLESEEKYRANMDWYHREISRCTYRQFTTGFYYGKPNEESQIYDSNTYQSDAVYLGTVYETDHKGRARIEQRNKFCVGDVIEISRNSAKVAGAVPAGAVLVDGLGIGDVGNVVLRDRRHLSQDGLMTVVVGLSEKDNKLVSGPDIVTRGFVYVRENEELMVQAREVVKKSVESCIREAHTPDWGTIKTRIRDDLREFLYQKTKRSPMILPIIMEV